jgi:cardiolipin synthase
MNRRRLLSIAGALIIVSLGVALTESVRAARRRPIPASVALDPTDTLAVSDAQFVRMLELYTGTHIDPGNSVQHLLNGNGTYPLLWRDLTSARRTITMQMYYAKPGWVSDTLATILAERARAGVRVLLLFDAFGAEAMGRGRWVARLRQKNVEVAFLRPLEWYTIHSAANRSHVRAVVVDGRIGYTGGFGLADYWLGDGRRAEQWRESNVRFEGPAVLELQAAFAAAWAEATGELLGGERFFPNVDASWAGGARAGLLFTTPTVGSTAAERFLTLVIRSARRTLYVTNSYFVPNRSLRGLMEQAVARGVDVRILTAGAKTDVKTPLFAGRHLYRELLSHGVRIYEYQPAMMHAKTVVVDGRWVTIGSMNFDSRSLAFNNESNLVVADQRMGSEMDSVFFADLQFATEVTLPDIERRPWWERLVERGASMLSRIL